MITVGVPITEHRRLHVGRRRQRLTVIGVRIRPELVMTVVGRSA